VGALTTWSQVAAGAQHSLAVKTDGTLWSWGFNGSGCLGLGDDANRSSPVQVGALTGWSQVAAGRDFSFSIKTNGTLWSWGFNDQGMLGLGDVVYRSSPVQVGLLTTWLTLPKMPRSKSPLVIKTS
jgi:alpha-tubulin suppressor-like RCC1 family protein